MSRFTPETRPARRAEDKRILVVGSAVAGLLLLGGSLLLTGGEEEQAAAEVAFAVPRRPAVAAPSTAAPFPTAPAPRRDPVNPFLAGVTDGSGGAAADTAADAAGGPVAGAPTDPAAGDLPVPPAVPATDVPATDEPPVDVLPLPPGQPTVPVEDDAPPAPLPPGSTEPPATVPPAKPTTAAPTSPVAARRTLVLTRVTGTAPDLVGRFLVDSKVVTVPVGDDAVSSFGPGLVLVGLEESGTGWTAVVRVGEGAPVNVPAGEVLRFG